MDLTTDSQTILENSRDKIEERQENIDDFIQVLRSVMKVNHRKDMLDIIDTVPVHYNHNIYLLDYGIHVIFGQNHDYRTYSANNTNQNIYKNFLDPSYNENLKGISIYASVWEKDTTLCINKFIETIIHEFHHSLYLTIKDGKTLGAKDYEALSKEEKDTSDHNSEVFKKDVDTLVSNFKISREGLRWIKMMKIENYKQIISKDTKYLYDIGSHSTVETIENNLSKVNTSR